MLFRSWTDSDGKNRSLIRVIVEEFEFVDAPKKNSSDEVVSAAIGASPSSSDYDVL